jgi:hypothetical protein
MIVLKRLLIFMAVLLAMAHSSARANVTVLDVSSPANVANGTAAIGDGFIVSGFFEGSAGSGNIDPFLRLGTNADFERGYNTSIGLPLDDKPPQPGFTHALLLSDVPIVNISGINYREFVLDANQTGNGNISLNQVQIFQTASDVGSSNNLQDADATHNASISFTGFPGPVFQMSANLLSGTTNEVLINSGNGSGTLDMALYVKDSLFTNTPSSFVTLFSQFGSPPGQFAADDGFEEWKVREVAAAVPEPSTLAVAGLGALGFVCYGLRRRLKK